MDSLHGVESSSLPRLAVLGRVTTVDSVFKFGISTSLDCGWNDKINHVALPGTGKNPGINARYYGA